MLFETFVLGYISLKLIGCEIIIERMENKKREIIQTELGDSFLLEYHEHQHHRLITYFSIMDIKGKELVGGSVRGKLKNKTAQIILNKENMRCYYFYETFLYKVNNEYGGIGLSNVKYLNEDYNLNERSRFLFKQIARELVATKNWQWIKICAKFLIEDGNEDLRQVIKRYSYGGFTPEEIEVNKENDITKEEMKSFSKELLKNINWITVPDAPHIGCKTGGKRSGGGAVRGNILVDEVPYGR